MGFDSCHRMKLTFNVVPPLRAGRVHKGTRVISRADGTDTRVINYKNERTWT